VRSYAAEPTARNGLPVTLRTWLRQPVGKWWLHLILWPPAALLLLALILVYVPEAWDWLTSSEDLGARLRRECESVAREALTAQRHNDLVERQAYIRQCVDSRARLVR